MVPEKRIGLGTLVKIGLAAGGIYWAYRRRGNKDAEDGAGDVARAESPNAGSSEAGLGVDAAAREIGDFAARVLKAAKRIPDAMSK
jgi:hypothetical protein